MANYRFKTAEIEAMKKNILTHIEHEAETETAWRLRCAIEGQLMCCRPSKRDAARLERELALYEKLAKNDLPNWQSEPTQPATPTETPQISTETAETTELSAEATKAEEAPKYSISERDGNVYVTFKRGVIRQCAKRCGVSCKSAEWNTIAQAYNGTHSDMGMGLSFFFDGREDAVRFAELVCNGDISGYYKLYMDKIIAEGEARKKRIAEKCAEYDAAQAYFAECMADEDAETVNVSAEGEKEAETKEMPQILNCELQTVEHFKAIPNIAKLAKAGIIINGVAWHTEYLDKAHNVLARVDNLGWHDDGKDFGDFQGSGVFGKTAIFKCWDNAVIATIDALTDYLQTTAIQPPQSPETPQTVDCATDTPKPRETARKPQNRGIGNTRHSRLGANGYSVLNDASVTMNFKNITLTLHKTNSHVSL